MPPRHAAACVMSDGGKESPIFSSESSGYLLKAYVDQTISKEHAVLMIEDFDAKWFQALATRFPASLDVRFLAQHVLRMGELKASYDLHNSLFDGYKNLVSRVDAEISRRLAGTTADSDRHSRHIDGRVARYGHDAGPVHTAASGVDGYRLKQFSK